MGDFRRTFSVRRLWIILSVGTAVMFTALLALGWEIYQKAPPIPEAVRSQSGRVIYTRENIQTGQQIWQSIGGMQQGSIWGHGGYVAPDWTADWLHREAVALLAIMSADGRFTNETAEQQDALRQAALSTEMRKNTYDPATGTITVSDSRARAIDEVEKHFSALYEGRGEEALKLRRQYAFPKQGFLTRDETHNLSAFYFWTAWGATTNRPGDSVTYTSNWPYEPLVSNRPAAGIFMWTIISIVILLAGIGAIVWYYAKQYDQWRDELLRQPSQAGRSLKRETNHERQQSFITNRKPASTGVELMVELGDQKAFLVLGFSVLVSSAAGPVSDRQVDPGGGSNTSAASSSLCAR
jgi:nitric oxide reductase subunit B